MKQRILLLLNTLTLLAVLLANYLAGTGLVSDKSVGDVSAQYENLFTPAGYAFSIWGLIFLMLIAFVTYQWVAWLKSRDDEALLSTGPWFMLSNIFNGAWIFAWLSGYLGISVILMFLLLASLIILMFRLRLETWDAPVRIIAFVWWPITIYIGWIVAASVANVSAYLVGIDWQMWNISETTWSVVMIVAATAIYILLIFARNMREAAAVGIWALMAIAVKQWGSVQETALTAVICSAVLFVLITYHALRNWKTMPFFSGKI
jgi:hypothetical protein